ncbi:MAG: GNAT family N-acetyltransferase, partial [Gemmatimonadetes bacterium]|nr:GNAT family N-acetyltransferase [Gemmatimonadota bacterium]
MSLPSPDSDSEADFDAATNVNAAFDAAAFTPSDLEACLALFDSNVPDYFQLGERSEFRTFLDDLPGPYVVLRDGDGEVVACGGWAVSENGVADLCWGMVRGDLHGRGWGRRLTLARLRGIEATPGVRVVELRTSQHTDGFYRTFGFRTVETRP